MKQYYSIRTGKNKNFSGFNLDTLRRLFSDAYNEFENNGYFQEYFGYFCVDASPNQVAGKLGENVDAQIYRLLRKDHLWPIGMFITTYSEDDLFDIIEFLYDHISRPIKKDNDYHSWNQCGWHYSEFNKDAGQNEFIEKMNEILADYETGFEMDKNGLILVKDESGLANIYLANIPTDREDIKTKVDLAVQKYRESRSSLEMRRIAIRELADILEILRPEAKQHLNSKDDDALFNIANNFSIRHANDKQKIGYDRDIWYSWMFYFYLATVHALLRIKERKDYKVESGAK